jgi:superfamily II DNA or RNA helicase
VIQAVGRILRIAEGKKQPIVVDIVDEKTEACRDFYNRRAKRYLQRGYEVKKIEKPR